MAASIHRYGQRWLWGHARLPRTRIPLAARDWLTAGAGLLGPRARGGAGEAALVAAFETALAARLGRRHAVVVGSGKAALALALDVLDLPPGSGVVLPALLVPEVVAVLLARRLVPVIVDVDERTFGLDPPRVEAVLTPTTRAILPVHVFGTPCAVDGLEALAARHGLVLLEDAAQALGARVAGRPVGSFGPVSTVSLGLLKNVNTLRGGAALTDDDTLAARMRARRAAWPPNERRELLRTWLEWALYAVVTHPGAFTLAVAPLLAAIERVRPGWSERAAAAPDAAYHTATMDLGPYLRGFDGVRARLGAGALGSAESRTAVRAANAAILDAALDEVTGPGGAALVRQRPLPGTRSIRLNYVVLVPDRDRRLPALRRACGLDLAPGYVRDVGAVRAFAPYVRSHTLAGRIEREHVYVPVQHDVPPAVFEERARRLARALGAG
jgi:dTDP-4-amino-4,6-dideoxygalactose transaminase